MLKTAVLLLVVYLAFAGLVFATQRKMLYLPGHVALSAEQAAARGLRHWPSRDAFRGYLGVGGDHALGTAVVFHGNAGTAGDRSYYADALGRRGYRVLLAEYPGYDGRPGSPTEAALCDDAAETLRRVHAEFGAPIVVVGESLGAGVAAAMASAHPDLVDALVLITPWDSLPAVAQAHYWYLPARWLVRDRFDNVANLRDYRGPVAVVLAERDEIVPVRHGRTLFDAIAAPKELWVLSGAMHNTWPAHPEATWWAEVVAHVSQ